MNDVNDETLSLVDDADNDDLLFADEDGPSTPAGHKPWKLLIVDDEEEVHNVTRLALAGFTFAGRELHFLHARSAAEARRRLAEHKDIAVILLDVVMETEHAGLDLVRYIRGDLGNRFVRIVLRTGQPGQAPEHKVIVDYDINDYKAKTELTHQRLFTTVYTSLSSYRDLMALEANRRGLEKIVDASASIFELRSMERFAQGVLEQLTALLYLGDDAMMMRVTGVVAEHHDNALEILAGVGRYRDKTHRDLRAELPPLVLERIHQVLMEKRPLVGPDYYVVAFPNRAGREHVLYVCGDQPLSVPDFQLVDLFCRNVAIAEENIALKQEIEDTQKEIVYLLSEAIEKRSRETGNHVRRVGEYARLLARLAGLSPEEAELLLLAAPLHDAGKIAIPDAILNKPGRHTPEESEVMRRHAALGQELLYGYRRPLLLAAARIAGEHHEKWDGSGYPAGKAGEDIHIYGRITALADVFDALGSDRCYKQAWPLESILDFLRHERGRHFDPRLVDLLLDNLDDFIAIRDRFADVEAMA
ncbi:MAG: DUF3369 domain-containing protein [Pseudomonadota bacterium]|nr:DUF3369 domain-containing protein [Pseudomonadota bacterium]